MSSDSAPRVLIACANAGLSRALTLCVQEVGGFAAIAAADTDAAADEFFRAAPELILAADDPPRLDAVALCSKLRAVSQVAIVALIEPDQLRRRVEALNCGADATLPFSVHPDELVAVLRRLEQRACPTMPQEETVDRGDFHLARASGRCVVAGREVRLTAQEFRLLWHMAAEGNTEFTHEELQRAVWGEGNPHTPAFLRPVVLQVRKKIELDWRHPVYILTDHTLGYRFNAVAQPDSDRAETSVASTSEWFRGLFRNP